MKKSFHIISIDVGSDISGLCVISDNRIVEAVNLPNTGIAAKIREYYVKYDLTVVVEDIRPYALRITKEVIAACKFIGELSYRLKTEFKVPFYLYPRSKVKKWVFDAFPEMCIGAIDKKIAYLDDYGERKGKKRYRTKTGELRKASFNYVDDRVVISVMKRLWKIPEPKPFKSNIYGLKKDSWQALALGSYFLYGLPAI